MQENTCFEHAHYAVKDMLCSGEGLCAKPVLRVRNEGNMSVDVQLFAQTGCDTSMHRLSLFESVPDFAAANCMCSFRNWFHFLNTTAGTQAVQNIIKVWDRMVHYTNREKAEMLSEMRVLQTWPHPCDRTYAHTDYNTCRAPSHVATDTATDAVEELSVSKTWSYEGDEWYARFCNMWPSLEAWGFLNPYLPESGTLHSAAADVRLCSEFAMCPVVHFHVCGRTVDRRRVRTYTSNDDSLYGVQAAPAQTMREYCGLDAQRCWGMGYLLGENCAKIDKEKSDICVVDRLVLPLVSIFKQRNLFGSKTSCAAATLHGSFYQIVPRQKKLRAVCGCRVSLNPPLLMDQ
jgi:hypothetical protein